jgi:hypothetical protein
LKNKVEIIEVKRQKRGKMRYFEQSISTDGKTFIEVKHDDNDGGFEWELNKSMAKEFFRKLKKLNEKSNN